MQACRLLCSNKQSLEQLVNISSECQRLNAPQLQRLLADYSYVSQSQLLNKRLLKILVRRYYGRENT